MSSNEDEIQGRLLRFHQTRYPNKQRVEILDLARISDGWETDVYSFALEHGPAGERERQPLVLRLYPGEGATQKSEREYSAMQQLCRSGYPVPRVLLLEREGASLSKPFVIMERIASSITLLPRW